MIDWDWVVNVEPWKEERKGFRVVETNAVVESGSRVLLLLWPNKNETDRRQNSKKWVRCLSFIPKPTEKA